MLYLITCNVFPEENEIEMISSLITNQYMELWNILKIGDFIENTFTKNKFILDKSSKLKIIQNNLILKNLFIDKYILPHFYTLTDYKLNYFDDISIINTYTKMKYYNPEILIKQPIFFDINKLHLLQNLNINNISHYQKNNYSILYECKYTVIYLYIIFSYNKNEYMIISKYSDEYLQYDIKKEIIKFMTQFKTENNIFFCEDCITDDILNIANIENINIENIIYLIGSKQY